MQGIVRFFKVWIVLALLAACSPTEEVDRTDINLVSATPQSASARPIGLRLSIDKSSIPLVDQETAKLFLFIREPGERMPLAVEHFAMTEIPKVVSFAGQHAQQKVEVVARISPSGRVEKSPEDIEIIQTLLMAHPPQSHVVSFTPPTASDEHSKIAARVAIRIGTDKSFPDEAVVFVVAKSKRKPIPLAVRRLKVSDLPTNIILTDEDSMLPSHTLSAATRFAISARVSSSGSASRERGDWISGSIDYQGEGELHRLVIDTEIE